jgi:hypothetical protein
MQTTQEPHCVQNVQVGSTIHSRNKLLVFLFKWVITFRERLRKSFVLLENLDLEMLRFVLIAKAERIKNLQETRVAQIVQLGMPANSTRPPHASDVYPVNMPACLLLLPRALLVLKDGCR